MDYQTVGIPCFHDLVDLKILFVPDIQLESMPVPEKKPPQPMTGLSNYLSEVRIDLVCV